MAHSPNPAVLHNGHARGNAEYTCDGWRNTPPHVGSAINLPLELKIRVYEKL